MESLNEDSEDSVEFEYGNFSLDISVDQAKELCLLLRKNEAENTKFLNDLESKIENYLFENMTLEDAEDYFYEN